MTENHNPDSQAPRYIALADPHAADVFVRQRNDYSCGVACLATAANLYGLPKQDYDFFKKILGPSADHGIRNDAMIETAKKYLPFDGAGEGAYTGGIAVANIMQEGVGHFVVFLARDKDKILYYEPYYHNLVLVPEKEIEWVSETDKLQKWAINFSPLPGNSIEKFLSPLIATNHGVLPLAKQPFKGPAPG